MVAMIEHSQKYEREGLKKGYSSHERRSDMTTSPFSTVIGVFPALDQAERAIDELRHSHFSYDRIRLVERGTGSFFDPLKGMFTGQAAVTSNAADNLIKMGLPEYEAQHYQSELDAHHVLVMMNADERPEDAFNIMRQSGAFDINARLRTAPLQGSTKEDIRRESQATPQGGTPAAAPSSNAPAPAPRSDTPQTPARNS